MEYDVVYVMVITTFIYQETSSALIASLFPLFQAVATLIAGFILPLLYQKFSFSKLFVNLQGQKAILLTLLLLGFEPITNHIYVLLIVVFVISFLAGLRAPLLNSVIPKIVAKDKLVKANSSITITTQSAQIAGFSFTGFAVLNWGHSPTLTFNIKLLWTLYCV